MVVMMMIRRAGATMTGTEKRVPGSKQTPGREEPPRNRKALSEARVREKRYLRRRSRADGAARRKSSGQKMEQGRLEDRVSAVRRGKPDAFSPRSPTLLTPAPWPPRTQQAKASKAKPRALILLLERAPLPMRRKERRRRRRPPANGTRMSRAAQRLAEAAAPAVPRPFPTPGTMPGCAKPRTD